MRTSKTGNLKKIVSMSILWLILNYSFARCYQWGKLEEECLGSLLFLTPSYNLTIISIKISVKKYTSSPNVRIID